MKVLQSQIYSNKIEEKNKNGWVWVGKPACLS
jgi:hypothetical protein